MEQKDTQSIYVKKTEMYLISSVLVLFIIIFGIVLLISQRPQIILNPTVSTTVIEEVTEERSVEKHPSGVSTSVEEVKVEETITPDDTWKEQLREYKTRLNNL